MSHLTWNGVDIDEIGIVPIGSFALDLIDRLAKLDGYEEAKVNEHGQIVIDGTVWTIGEVIERLDEYGQFDKVEVGPEPVKLPV